MARNSWDQYFGTVAGGLDVCYILELPRVFGGVYTAQRPISSSRPHGGKESLMISRRASTLTLVMLAVMVASTSAFARHVKVTSGSSGYPMVANFSTVQISPTVGVLEDAISPLYEYGVDGVQCYIGVSGKDLDLVTYDTSRNLHFKFDTSQTAWQNSGIPSDFSTVVDFYGINYYGRYQDQGIGTTAQVAASLQFYVGRVTYRLDYQSLASMRTSRTSWLITSDPNDIPGYPGFYASDQAVLGVVRRKANKDYGTVNMPIRFEVTLQ